MLEKLGLKQPANGTATCLEEAECIAEQIGYPVLVRPSYVLGGRAMEIIYDNHRLAHYMANAVQASPEHPVLVDDFLDDATEVDVDAISDGERVVIAGVMEHIEEAGIHSGDSACSLPPFSIPPNVVNEIKRQTKVLAKELNVIGLVNIQFAIKDDDIYILEVNPRASRTVPFVSKAVGVPFAKLAARVMAGKKLADLGLTEEKSVSHIAVKESVFPFIKFPEVDVLLGPEMKSTGEVMGIASTFGAAFAKSQIATGVTLPQLQETIFISIKNSDKSGALEIAKNLHDLGYKLIATKGTADFFRKAGLPVTSINKVKEGSPHIVESIIRKEVSVVINTTFGDDAIQDSFSLRRACLTHNIAYYTTLSGGIALVEALRALKENKLGVTPLQEYEAGP